MTVDSKTSAGSSSPAEKGGLRLAIYLADQNLQQTKSLGILNLSVALLQHLARHPQIEAIHVLSNSTLVPVLGRLPEHVQVEICDGPARGKRSRIFWDQWKVYSWAKSKQADWLLMPKGFLSFCRRPSIPTAAFVHDAMIDLYRREYPAHFVGPENAYFWRSFLASIRRADLIFTQSDFTFSEIQRVAKERALPIPRMQKAGIGFDAPDELDARAGLGKTRHGSLVLASTHPHKETPQAIQFMNRWLSELRDSADEEAATNWVGSFPEALPEPVLGVRHPRLSHQAYADLQGSVKRLVYFSRYEGFGMPPVEAVLAGAVPVYTDLPATREAMLGLGCPFERGNYDSFAAAMHAAAEVTPDMLGDWRKALLQAHQWSRVTQTMVDAFRAIDAVKNANKEKIRTKKGS